MTDVTAAADVSNPRGLDSAARKLRMEQRYVIALIKILQAHPNGLRRWSVMRAMRAHWDDAGLSISQKFEDDVERAFRKLCAGAEAFKNADGAPEDAVFYRPEERAGDVWAVYPERAGAYLATAD